MVTFSLASFQCEHHDWVEILQDADMVILCHKTVQLFPVVFNMRPSCLILASEHRAVTIPPSDPNLWHTYPCVTDF